VLVFIHTSAFRTDGPQYSRSVTVSLRRQTADSGLVALSAVRGLRAIYRSGFRYAKAGVMLLALQDAAVEQRELDLDDACEDRSRLMGAMDAINDRYGRGALTLASAGTAREARTSVMKQDLRTPDYMTRWTDLPCARA
jgi:DNA polymerase V